MDPRPSNRTTAERDVEAVFHPYTNLIRHRQVGPLVITHGNGPQVGLLAAQLHDQR